MGNQKTNFLPENGISLMISQIEIIQEMKSSIVEKY